MLELIIQLLTYVKQVTYFGLVLSYKIGQLIVYGLKLTLELLLRVNKGVSEVLRVLYEDFYVFITDVGQRLLFIVTFITDILQGFIDCITYVFGNLKLILLNTVFAVTEIYNAIFSAIAKVFTGFGQIFVAMKYLIVLLGSGIWFALTIVPLFIVYTWTMLIYYLGCLLQEVKNITSSGITFINAAYDFITDVPLESIAGLISGACILYVMIKYQILLYQFSLSAFEIVRHYLQHLPARLMRRLIRRRPVPQEVSSSESEEVHSSDETDDELEPGGVKSEGAEDRICIICHERIKCILMLPCRHVCLCYACNTRLRNYNRTCPICRTVVQETMKVFV